jgi:hypothetical protein
MGHAQVLIPSDGDHHDLRDPSLSDVILESLCSFRVVIALDSIMMGSGGSRLGGVLRRLLYFSQHPVSFGLVWFGARLALHHMSHDKQSANRDERIRGSRGAQPHRIEDTYCRTAR